MFNLQVGKDLKLTMVTAAGKFVYYGQYVGSDQNTFVLKLGAHTPMERKAFFYREHITAIEEATPGMMALAS